MTAATLIKSCAATSCAFNNDGCTAVGITVAGGANKASCATFLQLDARAGLDAAGTVGACQRIECVHNTGLLCGATAIELVGDAGDCSSYQVN